MELTLTVFEVVPWHSHRRTRTSLAVSTLGSVRKVNHLRSAGLQRLGSAEQIQVFFILFEFFVRTDSVMGPAFEFGVQDFMAPRWWTLGYRLYRVSWLVLVSAAQL